MLEVTVKTLDGKNKNFCVPDDIGVKEFKAKIANSIEIAADLQRLIFQGKVLQDEKKLKDYGDVNGSVLHVVARPPPGARGQGAEGGATPSTGGANSHTYMQGSFSMTGDTREAGQVQNVVEQALSSMGDLGRNVQVSTRSNSDGSAVEVHINLGNVSPPQVQSGSQLCVDQARRMVQKANRALHKLENPRESSEEGGSGRHSPMEAQDAGSDDNDSQDATTSQEGATANTQPTAESSGSTATTENSTAEGAEAPSTSQPRRLTHPSTNVLAELLQQVMELNTRLEPHLERYHRITEEDRNYQGDDDGRRDAQRVQNRVSQALHYIAHAYHHISDLMIDMNVAPPRQVRAPPTSIIQQQGPTGLTYTQQHVRHPGPAPSCATATTSSATASARTASSSSTSTTSTTASGQTGPTMMFPGGPFPPGVHVQMGGPFAPGVHVQMGSVVLPTMSPSSQPPTASSTAATTTSRTSSTEANGRQTAPPGGVGFRLPAGSFPLGPMPFMMATPPGRVLFAPQQGRGTAATSSGTSSSTQTPPTGRGPASAQGTQTPAAGRGHTFEIRAGIPMSFTFPPRHVTLVPGSVSGGATPASSGSSNSQTSQSASTSQAGQGQQSQGQQPQGPMGFMIPGPVGPGVLPGMPAGIPAGFMAIPAHPGADRLLPCQSRHIIAQRAQDAGSIGNQPPGMSEGLGNMVNEIVMGLMRHQNPFLSPEAPRTTQSSSSQPAATASTTGDQPDGGQPAGNLPADLPFIHALRNLLQNRTNPGDTATTTTTTSTGATPSTSSATTTTSSSSSSSSSSAPVGDGGSEMSDELFAQLVQGISGFVSRVAMGQQPTDTISDFLGSIGQSYNLPQGEGLLTDVFNCVARTLTFTDFMAVFYGQANCLGSLRDPLRELVTVQVLDNQPMNEENVNRAIERIVQDMQPELEAACTDVEAKDDIDYPETVNAFTRHCLKLLIDLIMRPTDGEADFGNALYATCRTAIHQFAALSQHCLKGGRADVVRLVEGRVRAISQDVNPMIQQWMVNISSQEAANLVDSVSGHVPTSEFERFIVRRSSSSGGATRTTSPGAGSSDNSYMSADDGPETSGKAKEVPACNGHADEVMRETGNCVVPTETIVFGDSASTVVQRMEVDSGVEAEEVDLSPGGGGIPAAVRARLPPPPVPDPSNNTPVVVGSADWHSQVPEDWVPVITRDANRQRRQAETQGPFSDAYLNGMSVKRRRIVAQQKQEQTSAMGDMTRVLPDAIKKAAQSVGVEPITSHEHIARDVAANSALCSAFEDQICDSVQKRLETDPDFVSEKYPKSEKFFKKK